MILQPFLRRHFLMTSVVFLLIMTAGSFISHSLSRWEHTQFFRAQGSVILSAVEKREDKLTYVKEVNASNHELGIPLELDVVKDGVSLLTNQTARDFENNEGRIFTHAIQLPEEAQFVVNFAGLRGSRHPFFGVTFMAMAAAILLASALSMFLLFYSFRARADLAKSVLTRMQKGDLKARFPTSRLDETGKMMVLFNQMADEIERLVERLKQNETHRLQLLQELTHDLRTPVSSLRNLIETLRFDESRLAATAKAELMELAFQETEYLTRLVEDLLFLALVLEPKYKIESREIDVAELAKAQLHAVAVNNPDIRAKFIASPTGHPPRLTGSAHLMQRLFRNALANAFSFAKQEVEVELRESAGTLELRVRDDGPGLTPEALESFGKKRSTRYQGSRQNSRISVGLGSVIIQAIASAHGGSVQIHNRLDAAGKVLGAELIVRILSEPAPQ